MSCSFCSYSCSSALSSLPAGWSRPQWRRTTHPVRTEIAPPTVLLLSARYCSLAVSLIGTPGRLVGWRSTSDSGRGGGGEGREAWAMAAASSSQQRAAPSSSPSSSRIGPTAGGPATAQRLPAPGIGRGEQHSLKRGKERENGFCPSKVRKR